jgi:hypothetical protein
MLSEQVDSQAEWIKAEARTIPEVIDFLCKAADEIESREKAKYDAAVVNAKLPAQVSGETYIRGWRRIREFDRDRGPLEAWLGGFVPRLYMEDWRPPLGCSYDENTHNDINDWLDAERAESGSGDEEFEIIFDQIRDRQLAGIDWAEQVREDLRLIDIYRQALITQWCKLSHKHQGALADALCNGIDRETVAQKHGFKQRNGVDKLVGRFIEGVKKLAAQLRAKFGKGQ